MRFVLSRLYILTKPKPDVIASWIILCVNLQYQGRGQMGTFKLTERTWQRMCLLFVCLFVCLRVALWSSGAVAEETRVRWCKKISSYFFALTLLFFFKGTWGELLLLPDLYPGALVRSSVCLLLYSSSHRNRSHHFSIFYFKARSQSFFQPFPPDAASMFFQQNKLLCMNFKK